MSKLISRADADAAGLKRYNTGDRCIHGHVAERRVSNKYCVECQHDVDIERDDRRLFLVGIARLTLQAHGCSYVKGHLTRAEHRTGLARLGMQVLASKGVSYD